MRLFRGDAPAEALALRGRLQRGADGVRGARADRPRAAVLLGAPLARRGSLRERTRLLPRRAETVAARPEGRMRVRDRGVVLELRLQEEDGIKALCPHGRGEVWTRKQAGIAARGTLALDGGPARRDRGARGDRRHRRPPRPPHRVALERRRRRSADGVALGVEPRQRRQRPAAAAPSARCGSPGAPREVAPGQLRRTTSRHPLRGRLRAAASRPRPSAAAATTC